MITPDTYVGIDQSVGGFGLCFLTPGFEPLILVRKFPLSKYGGVEIRQLDDVENWLINQIADYHGRIKAVAREGFSYGSTQGREKAGALAYTVDRTLYGWLPEPACYPLVIPPTQVKKFATGDGSATKGDIIKAIQKQWGVEVDNDNAADAFVIARIAYAMDRDDDVTLTDFQREVIEDIKNPKKKSKKKSAKRLPGKKTVVV